MKHFVDLIEDFLRAYFDKLLLTAVLLLLVWIGANATSADTKTWAMGQANTVIGAIIMLTTGKIVEAMRNRPNGTTEAVKPETTTPPPDATKGPTV